VDGDDASDGTLLTSFGSVRSCSKEAAKVFNAIDSMESANRSNYFHKKCGVRL
jgi:hypothetical protein